jgi:hypothetical protein
MFEVEHHVVYPCADKPAGDGYYDQVKNVVLSQAYDFVALYQIYGGQGKSGGYEQPVKIYVEAEYCEVCGWVEDESLAEERE